MAFELKPSTEVDKPQEWRKPALPYYPGAVISIRKHAPPPPISDDDWREETEHCCINGRVVPNQSLPGSTHEERESSLYEQLPTTASESGSSPHGRWLQETDSLVFERDIRTGNGYRSQIFLCRRRSTNTQCVAKVYDALWYPTAGYNDDLHPDLNYPADRPVWGWPSTSADDRYINESAAYQLLSAKLGGAEIPRYYGSWTTTFQIDTLDGLATRLVALILVEPVPGRSWAEHDQRRLEITAEQRMDLLARALHTETVVFSSGVDHSDFAARNLVCDPGRIESAHSKGLRVVLLDFDHAELRTPGRNRHVREIFGDGGDDKKPISPIERWWDQPPREDYWGEVWFSPFGKHHEDTKTRVWHDADMSIWRAWLWERFGSSPFYLALPDYASPENFDDTEWPHVRWERLTHEKRLQAKLQGLPDPIPSVEWRAPFEKLGEGS